MLLIGQLIMDMLKHITEELDKKFVIVVMENQSLLINLCGDIRNN